MYTVVVSSNEAEDVYSAIFIVSTLKSCTASKSCCLKLLVNPAVIIAARSMFFLPDDDRKLQTLKIDAHAFVHDAQFHNHFDAVQVDLYDAICDGPSASSLDFYTGCYNLLKSPGILTVNLFSRHKSFDINLSHICEAFHDRVLLFPESHDCNVVAMAFKGPPLNVEWAEVVKRAKILQAKTDLPTASWATGLRRENARQDNALII